MADETADVSTTRSSWCFASDAWVDDDLIVHEDFIGMHPIKGTGADQIVFLITHILLRMNAVNAMMVLQRWQGQKLALQPKLKQLMVNASIPTTTDVGDSIKSVAYLKGVFEVVHAICKLIKKSPKRTTKLYEMRKQPNNDCKGIHALCPTRWTVRGKPSRLF